MPRRTSSRLILRALKRLAENPTWENFSLLKALCLQEDIRPCGTNKAALPYKDCQRVDCPLYYKPHGFSNYCSLIAFPSGFASGKNAKKKQERETWAVYKGELTLAAHRFLAWLEVASGLR